MAERDGTIVIDTQIDTKGVDAGSEKTEASLRRISFYQEQVIRVVRKCKKVRWLKLIYTYASEIVNNEGEKRHG